MTDDIKVLDHGYVKYVESWGSDERIIEAARMSTNKGFLGWGPIPLKDKCPECDGTGIWRRHPSDPTFSAECQRCSGVGKVDGAGDEKLLKYLWDNKHATPFEMAGMVIEVQAPIMVFREWHRHRTQSYNEMSARYTQLPDMFYVPAPERVRAQSKANKQGTSVEELPPKLVARFREELEQTQKESYARYEWALNNGVPRELARLHLPVSIYSRMRAQANLRNWLAFLTLRSAPGAQYEIRVFADAVGQIIAERFPRTWELFAAGKK